MSRIVVVGGGWSGVSAAVCAKKAGAEVTLIEKTDLLLGAGNVGGIFRNNGRYTAEEEMRELGAGDLFAIMDACAVHKDLAFPGHAHDQFIRQEKYKDRFTFSGGAFFEIMKEEGLYSTDIEEIAQRVRNEKLSGLFSEKIDK